MKRRWSIWIVGALVAASVGVTGCKKDGAKGDAKPGTEAPEDDEEAADDKEFAAAAAAASAARAKFPAMNKGTKKLKSGKLLGDVDKDGLKKAVEDAGFKAYSWAASQSGGATIITVGAKKKDPTFKTSVDLYAYPDPALRKKRFAEMESKKDHVLFKDGDYLMTVRVVDDKKEYNEAESKKLLAALVGS